MEIKLLPMVTKLIIGSTRTQFRQSGSRVLLNTVLHHLSDSIGDSFFFFMASRLLKAFDPKLLGTFRHLENRTFLPKVRLGKPKLDLMITST